MMHSSSSSTNYNRDVRKNYLTAVYFNIEWEWLTTFTAARHQGAKNMLWLHVFARFFFMVYC